MTDLKEGEIVCNKCGGTGRTTVKLAKPTINITGFCLKCSGRGKLDWIENITGVKRGFFRWDLLPKIRPEFLKDFPFKISPKPSKQEKQKNRSLPLTFR